MRFWNSILRAAKKINQTCNMFFDILPENAIENIVRNLSDSPRAQKWTPSINLEEIFELYDVTGDLGKFLHGRFTGVYLHNATGKSREYIRFLDDGIVACKMERVFNPSTSPIGSIGQSFETLIVGRSSIDYSCAEIRNRIGCLSDQWTNIRSLVFACGAGDERVWMEKFGSANGSLIVGNLSADNDYLRIEIPNRCSKLRRLDLNEEFWITGADSTFWKKVGSSLELLSATFSTETIGQIHLVEKYCRKIKHIRISGAYGAVNDAVSKCISSYGSLLERAQLKFLSERQLELVKSACSNARFDLSTYRDIRHLKPSLTILGVQLESIEVRSMYYSSEELPIDWDACVNVERAKFGGDLLVSDIRQLVKTPKHHLKCIDIKVSNASKELTNVITLIANGTRALEDFKLECRVPALGAFDKLVEMNKSLSYVNIYFHSVLPNAKAIHTLETFLKAPGLKNIALRHLGGWTTVAEPIPEIERICRQNRYRRLCVSVLGVPYLR